MKNFSLAILFVGVVTMLHSAPPTAPTMYGPLKWEGIFSQSPSTVGNNQNLTSKGTGKDTIVGADTMRLINKLVLEDGCSYVLQLLDSCAAADTIKFMQYTYGSDGTTLMHSVSIDSLVGTNDAGYTQIQLTAGTSVFGKRVDVYAIGWISTLRCLIKRVELYKIKSILAN